jgi:hypothetical protein
MEGTQVWAEVESERIESHKQAADGDRWQSLVVDAAIEHGFPAVETSRSSEFGKIDDWMSPTGWHSGA